MKAQKTIVSFICLFLLSSLSLAAVGQQEPSSAPPEPVTIRLGGLQGPTSVSLAPFIIDSGRVGSDVQVTTEIYGTPDVVVGRLLAGEVDIAALPTNLASVLYNRDAGIHLLGVSGGGVLYVVADQEMDFDEITGQTVHTIARGSTPDIMLQTLAGGRGLHADDDYAIQYAADQTELAQNLIAGRVNLAVLPEPFASRVQQANPDLVIAVDLQQLYQEQYGLEYYPMTVLVVRSEFAQRHPQAVAAFSDDMPRAQRWLSENLATASAAAGETIGIPAAVIEASYPRLNLIWIPAAEAREGVLRYLQVFANFNPESVGGKVPNNDFFFQP